MSLWTEAFSDRQALKGIPSLRWGRWLCSLGILMGSFGFLAQSFADTQTETTTSMATRSRVGAKKGVRQLAWKMGLDGQSYANEKEQAQTAGVKLQTRFQYGLFEALEARVEMGLALESGYAQSQFGSNTPTSGFKLSEAVLQYKPARVFLVQAGAINQGHLEAPLLVSSQAFPGVLEKLSYGSKTFNIELKAQQAIPTSTTLSTKAVEAETSPSFMTETLTLRARPGQGPIILKAYGTHFAYRNLPSTVATESELLGNSVTGPGRNTSRFDYEFDGWLAGVGVKWAVHPKVIWNLDSQMIQNSQAEETYRNAQISSTSLEIALPRDIDLKPKAEIFFAESDVAPAFYNSSELGHNNRQGWAADLSASFNDPGFLIGARYVSSDVINASNTQSRQQYFMIRFETQYEVL